MSIPAALAEGMRRRHIALPDPPGMAESDVAFAAIDEDTELGAVARLRIAANLSTAGIGLALVVPVVVLLALVGPSFLSAGGSSLGLPFGLVVGLTLVILVGVVLSAVALTAYRGAFQEFHRVDGRFSVLHWAVLLGAAGLALIGLLFGIVSVALFQMLACGGYGGTGCISFDPARIPTAISWAGFGLGFVGWAGVVAGLYRLGQRYGSATMRLAAILYVVPIANVIAPVLVGLLAGEIERRFRARSAVSSLEPSPVAQSGSV